MNSGGAHCLKYGVTTNNLLGVTMVLLDGTVVEIGGKHLDSAGYDLLGLICGSEGQLGVVTEATVRILRAAEGARPALMGFDSAETAGACVAAIIGAGIIPVAMEYMDRLAIEISEAFAHAGYPLDVEAMLIIEVEGSDAEIEDMLNRIVEIAKPFNPKSLRVAQSEAEAAAIWKGRKSAFGATGRISDYLCMDGTIPTGQLPYVLKRMDEICHGLRPQGRQRVPRRRRQPASAHHVRHQQAGRDAEGRSSGRGHPETLRRGRRLPDGRARRRHREARPDDGPVQRRRTCSSRCACAPCSTRRGCSIPPRCSRWTGGWRLRRLRRPRLEPEAKTRSEARHLDNDPGFCRVYPGLDPGLVRDDERHQ